MVTEVVVPGVFSLAAIVIFLGLEGASGLQHHKHLHPHPPICTDHLLHHPELRRCRPWKYCDDEYISRIIDLSSPSKRPPSVAPAHFDSWVHPSVSSHHRRSLVSRAQEQAIESQLIAVPAVVSGEFHTAAMKSKPPIAGSNSVHHNGYLATRPAILGLSKVLFLGLCQVSYVAAAPVSEFLGIAKDKTDAPKDAANPSLWLYLGFAAILVLLGGAFAGLTIAYVYLDRSPSTMLIEYFADSWDRMEYIYKSLQPRAKERNKNTRRRFSHCWRGANIGFWLHYFWPMSLSTKRYQLYLIDRWEEDGLPLWAVRP